MTPVRCSVGVLRCAGAIAAAATLAACSSGGSGSRSATDASSAAKVANVTITSANGCALDRSSFAAGGITFKIANKDATAVTEVELLDGEQILGEKENVAAGLTGQFAVSVDAGEYTLYCPGARPERSTITVTGKAAAVGTDLAALISKATSDYKTYVDLQVGYLLAGVKVLDTALHGTDLAAAQKAYKQARPFYEKIEPVAETFVDGKQNLDADIDARDGDVPAAQWYGFHRIEKGLFAERRVAGLAGFGDKLVADVTTLRTKTAELTYKAPDLANGAQELLDEVASTKITGEEERYSHIDILDMANNVEGSEQAFADLSPALKLIDPGLEGSITSAFTSLTALLNTYRSGTDASGYVLYPTLDDADRRALAAAVKSVQEPLSQVASKVAGA